MTGIKSIDYAIIGLALLSSLAAAGVFVYTQFIFEKPLPSDAIEKSKLKEDAKKIVYPNSYELDKLIINLKSRTRRLRFLDVTVHLIPFEDGHEDVLEEKKAQIQDSVIEIASNMKPSELNSVAGKLLFINRVKKRTNQVLGANIVKDVQFSRFVVQ